MESESATVIAVEENKAVVQMQPGSLCRHCGARFACTALGQGVRQISVLNKIGAREGDLVRISYRPKARVFSALVIFIFPLILAVIGYFVGVSLFGTEGAGILCTFAGLIVAFIVVWIINRVFEKRQDMPEIVSREVQRSTVRISSGTQPS